jgi:hypothetical protein
MGSLAKGDGFRWRARGNARAVNAENDACASLAPISERLFHDFGAQVGLSDIVAIVRQCRGELDIVPAGAVPELVERLARERLRLRRGELELPSRSVEPRAAR